MFAAKDFFDLEGFRYREIFDRAEYVWDVLKLRDEYIRSVISPGIKGRVMEGAYITGDVQIDEDAVVEPCAFIKGPAIIGRGAVIRHGAYIREYSIIGDGAIVGHTSEVKGSILLNNAQAPHFAYVGDSVLGRKVNLGAGTKISNLKVTPGTIVVTAPDGTKIDTGLRKFGAIVGDGTQTGCNCVLNPGTLIGKGTLVYSNASIRGWVPGRSVLKLRQAQEVASLE